MVAEAQGMKVRKSVTQNLLYLVCGPNAGPSKIAQAEERGAYVLNEAGFLHLLETGEVPEQ